MEEEAVAAGSGGRVGPGLRLVLLALLCCAAGALSGPRGAAAAPGASVKYYVVQTAYRGEPENLLAIAARFLGDGRRYVDIYNLNKGRLQPDGGRLTDPTVIKPGWLLILPPDATGSGVEFGPPAQGGAAPAGSPQGSPGPAPSTPAALPPAGDCAAPSSVVIEQAPWAQLRLAPDQAWASSRGRGVTVAVLDSGVDAQVPQLKGHVVAGADIISGRGTSGTDCLGHGTAVAGIIAAQPQPGTGLVGIAPDAMVMPVRISTTLAGPRPDDVAAGIQTATSAGVQVINVPGPLDLGDPAVVDALSDAYAHDVVVVAPAPTADAGTVDQGAPATPVIAQPGLLNVGGIDANDKPIATYVPGTVDVVAPGANITTLGTGGPGQVQCSGTDYAAPFVTGVVALLRSSEPDLHAAEVVRRVQQSAQHAAGQAPHAQYGWGILQPAAALNPPLDAAPPGDAPPPPATRVDPYGLLLVAVLGAGFLGSILVSVRLRRRSAGNRTGAAAVARRVGRRLLRR
ncbi:S8 family serine peptidase [Dactylosporangium sp. AC04546]|uniref:S8 family serine peptidase n=1 Tax=Dactylosporangium sp. AC04546 TaxID=2862460 RepID=UPI001EE079ED|nr:S8 family serine peptidase [Dactylosporangium sp. AC04546]WVK86678.1 S8 family serine peptidase [Dactylosporangium sp. AC04546]